MKLRLGTKKLILTALVGAVVMLVICSVVFYIGYNKFNEEELALKAKYEQEVKKLSDVAEQSMQAYALNAEVERGVQITADMLEPVFVPNAAFAIDTLTPIQVENNQYYAKSKFMANTVILESLVYEEEFVTDDLRAMEYGFIHLPSKLKQADYVDVRVQFPNGEDFILFAKKKVIDVQGVTIWLNNDEGEILSMSSAMVDAFLNDAKIYATTYVDGTTQESLQMTYPVNAEVLSLIKTTPNVVNRAKLYLETQYRGILDVNLDKFGEQGTKKVRETESKYQSIKSLEDKERALIDQNSNSGYETELVNPEFGSESGE